MQDELKHPDISRALGDPMMTVSEAAKKLGVSVRSVQRYCKHGLLNHKWIHGKRHRELRIIPPIPLTLLPGVKRGTAMAGENLVSREEFEEIFTTLRREIALRDRRIESLERELERLSTETGLPGESAPARESLPAGFFERAGEIIDDYERIRPVEKKLILALAREVKEQEEFLKKLGFGKNLPD
jgi:hypothetical protein